MTDEINGEIYETVDRPIPFKIYSGLLRAYEDTDGRPRFKGIASSSVRDRHGDTMSASAIADMERAANDNLTIFLNHSYNVPEDVAGSVENAKMVERSKDGDGNPIWDLDFDVVVNSKNPRAVEAWGAIKDGTKLGLSIGAMIPEGGAVRDKKKGTYTFNHVDLLETSIVGIPANPRSWVQAMVKALKSTATPTQAVIATDVVNITPEALNEMSDNLDRKVLLAADDPKQAEPAEDAPPQPEEVPETPDDTPPQPQEVPEPDDKKKSVSDGSQGAPDSEPDDEPDDDVRESTQPDVDATLKSVLTETLRLYEGATSELIDVRRQLKDAIDERDAARRERDEAQVMSSEFMAKATFIIQKLADMPVGRKAVVRQAKDELSSLERIYGVETMKLIRSSNDGNGG